MVVGMKVILWIALCGLCIAAGHVILGAIALLLLLGCVPMRQEDNRHRARRESHVEFV
jgi:hypothetical protein